MWTDFSQECPNTLKRVYAVPKFKCYLQRVGEKAMFREMKTRILHNQTSVIHFPFTVIPAMTQ